MTTNLQLKSVSDRSWGSSTCSPAQLHLVYIKESGVDYCNAPSTLRVGDLTQNKHRYLGEDGMTTETVEWVARLYSSRSDLSPLLTNEECIEKTFLCSDFGRKTKKVATEWILTQLNNQ